MKKFLLILPFLLGSCSTLNSGSSLTSYDYNSVKDHYIKSQEIFNKKEYYYLYIYSYGCSHCKKIKNDIIQFALKHNNFYLCEYSLEIKVKDEINSVIGVSSFDEFFIKGTPSLFILENSIIKEEYYGSDDILYLVNK